MGIIRIIVVLAVISLVCIIAPKFVDGDIDDDSDRSGSEKTRGPLLAGDSFDMTLGEWKRVLSPELYKVARCGSTEAPFSGKYNKFFDKGQYYCFVCANMLFRSEAKLDSKSGWPAFKSPITKESVIEYDVEKDGVSRTGVRCAKCNSHIGFICPGDTKQKQGQTYTINSISLRFIPTKNVE